MTKFEEEVKRPKKAYIDPFSKRDVDFTGVAQKFTEGAQTLKEWKEYAFLLEDKLKLQQQALPVVPECVGIWIKKCQELNWMITDVLAPESWSSEFAKDTENWLKKSKENFNLLALAFITGKYQVEKPQLFYLKNTLTHNYLYHRDKNSLGEQS